MTGTDYAYAAALIDIVEQVEVLERLTKRIVGEMALDAPDSKWKM